jgi:actin-binding LIM protein
MVLLVKQEEAASGKTTATPVSESLPVQQALSPGPSSSQSELDSSSARQSRKDFFEKSQSKSLSLKSQLKSPFKFLGKTLCGGCKKKCSGEVLRVNDKYFHSQCFKCVECQSSLATGTEYLCQILLG